MIDRKKLEFIVIFRVDVFATQARGQDFDKWDIIRSAVSSFGYDFYLDRSASEKPTWSSGRKVRYKGGCTKCNTSDTMNVGFATDNSEGKFGTWHEQSAPGTASITNKIANHIPGANSVATMHDNWLAGNEWDAAGWTNLRTIAGSIMVNYTALLYGPEAQSVNFYNNQ